MTFTAEQQARDTMHAVLERLIAKDTRINTRPRWHLEDARMEYDRR